MDTERETGMVSELLATYPHPMLQLSERTIVDCNESAKSLFGPGWCGKRLEMLLGPSAEEDIVLAIRTKYVWVQPEWIFRKQAYKVFLLPFERYALLIFAAGFEQRDSEQIASVMLKVDQQLRMHLTSLLSQISLCSDKLHASDTAQFERYLGDMRQTTLRILRLSNNLRDMARFLLGAEDFEPSSLDLLALCRRVAGESAEFAGQKQLTLNVHCGADQLVIAGEESWLERMLFNLLSNAVLYSRPGGQIDITLSTQEKFVMLRVTDTGDGMDGAALMNAFGEYRCYSGQLPKQHKGMGLGLALVQAIARMHGGTVLIESRLGAGTTVSVSLPLRRVYEDPVLSDCGVDYTGEFRHASVEFSCLPLSEAPKYRDEYQED